MKTLNIYTTKFPDLGRLATGMRIADQLRAKLCNDDTLIGISIYRQLTLDRVPLKVTLKEIQESARDNREMVAGVIGEDLLCDILNLEL